MAGILLFFLALMLLFLGFPVAYTFAGISLLVGVVALGSDLFAFMPYRIMAIMENTIMMAIPMFIFMGVVLQKTGLAERLLVSLGKLFGGFSGGVAVSTILVGALLAATTGVVGASVVTMGVISLPVMMKHRYHIPTATGTICAAGTLGQIIPPSIILIILGEVMGIAVGDLFQAAIVPGTLLVSAYILYLIVLGQIKPEFCPPIEIHENKAELIWQVIQDVLPTLLLVVAVLGSIFTGIATPTESAALGSVGALILAGIYRAFSFKNMINSASETVKITSMVFAVLIGATAFSMVFSYSGSEQIVESYILKLPGEQWTFVFLSMVVILILGFFIDFIEIAFIVVPILTPIAEVLGINMLWFAILIAMNLQTSFLTPPFGFSLFYLKGVSPEGVKTTDIYRGALPFILLQVMVLGLLIAFPEWLFISG